MTRLRLTHPSELLFALLTRGTVAGVAVAVLCIVILELREYTVITFLYGVPFGALYGLLVAGGVYAVLAFGHRRRPEGVMRRSSAFLRV